MSLVWLGSHSFMGSFIHSFAEIPLSLSLSHCGAATWVFYVSLSLSLSLSLSFPLSLESASANRKGRVPFPTTSVRFRQSCLFLRRRCFSFRRQRWVTSQDDNWTGFFFSLSLSLSTKDVSLPLRWRGASSYANCHFPLRPTCNNEELATIQFT